MSIFFPEMVIVSWYFCLKKFKKDGNSKITLSVKANCSLDFGFVFAALRCVRSLIDGNQLSGCRLFSRYDIYIYIKVYVYVDFLNIKTTLQ